MFHARWLPAWGGGARDRGVWARLAAAGCNRAPVSDRTGACCSCSCAVSARAWSVLPIQSMPSHPRLLLAIGLLVFDLVICVWQKPAQRTAFARHPLRQLATVASSSMPIPAAQTSLVQLSAGRPHTRFWSLLLIIAVATPPCLVSSCLHALHCTTRIGCLHAHPQHHQHPLIDRLIHPSTHPCTLYFYPPLMTALHCRAHIRQTARRIHRPSVPSSLSLRRPQSCLMRRMSLTLCIASVLDFGKWQFA